MNAQAKDAKLITHFLRTFAQLNNSRLRYIVVCQTVSC